MPGSTRRALLSASALITLATGAAARSISGALPWSPNEVYPPEPARPNPSRPGGWHFLTPDEAATLDAIVARLIPADELGPGAREAGCTFFIDRQLAGPYGGHDWLYMEGPFPPDPLPQQGLQSPLIPRDQYRDGLAALNRYTAANHLGRRFEGLNPAEQDALLAAMEKGEAKFQGADARSLFALILANTNEGFFADPVYGGNRGMVGWKLLGFPGARYDYRDVIAAPDKPYKLPPVSLQGRPDWENLP